MGIVRCGGCGMHINVNEKHAEAQVHNHLLICPAFKWAEKRVVLNVERTKARA